MSSTISILFNYFSSSHTNYRIWSEIALEKLCIGLDLNKSTSPADAIIDTSKGKAFGKELLSQGGITELKSRINYAISKLTQLSKES